MNQSPLKSLANPLRRILLLVSGLLLLGGCALVAHHYLDQRYGVADQQRYDLVQPRPAGLSFRKDVRPVLERRCTVCHGCYDAPCQLKLTAWEGIARGASKDKVYDGTRLLATEPSRLFDDAFKAQEWRSRNFFPVLNERRDSAEANLQGSVLARMLFLKRIHPLPQRAVLGGEFDFSLDRNQQCPSIEEFDHFEQTKPLWGMPYGLSAISSSEEQLIQRWLEEGARPDPAIVLPEAIAARITRWEAFFNGDSLKSRLISRYIFEHLFLAALYFGDAEMAMDGQPYYFRLVRSSTPPGESIKLIASRRPYDDPGVARVYYRIERIKESILLKTHMPYRLDASRMARWQSLFFEPTYDVRVLPGYAPSVASNPFVSFAQIPMKSRYQFMLDEAAFTIMGFIKGPVCRGQVALNVINDQFWVVFLDPDVSTQPDDEAFFRNESENLRLPSELESNAPVLATWLYYAARQKNYIQAKVAYLPEQLAKRRGLGAELFWDGNGTNDNAALTVFRHFDSASVEKGLLGHKPQTVWVIGYPLLERLHYLLVAGFDVYGNVGHQLNTRLYMDFLRMEGEFNFLTLLPATERERLSTHWYRGAPDYVHAYLTGISPAYDMLLPFKYHTSQPVDELLDVIKQRVERARNKQAELESIRDTSLRKSLQRLSGIQGRSLQWLPQTVIMRVNTQEGPIWLTLLNNSSYSNIAQLFLEQNRRLPDEDTLTVLQGEVSAYPNAFWRLNADQLPTLAKRIQRLQSEADYQALMNDYGVRRTSTDFWVFSDELHQAMRKQMGVDYGLLDYNRLEDR